MITGAQSLFELSSPSDLTFLLVQLLFIARELLLEHDPFRLSSILVGKVPVALYTIHYVSSKPPLVNYLIDDKLCRASQTVTAICVCLLILLEVSSKLWCMWLLAVNCPCSPCHFFFKRFDQFLLLGRVLHPSMGFFLRTCSLVLCSF